MYYLFNVCGEKGQCYVLLGLIRVHNWAIYALRPNFISPFREVSFYGENDEAFNWV